MHAFLANFTILPFTEEDAFLFGRFRALLAASGTPIGAYDILIAVQGAARNLTIVTHNTGEFSRIPDTHLPQRSFRHSFLMEIHSTVSAKKQYTVIFRRSFLRFMGYGIGSSGFQGSSPHPSSDIPVRRYSQSCHSRSHIPSPLFPDNPFCLILRGYHITVRLQITLPAIADNSRHSNTGYLRRRRPLLDK